MGLPSKAGQLVSGAKAQLWGEQNPGLTAFRPSRAPVWIKGCHFPIWKKPDEPVATLVVNTNNLGSLREIPNLLLLREGKGEKNGGKREGERKGGGKREGERKKGRKEERHREGGWEAEPVFLCSALSLEGTQACLQAIGSLHTFVTSQDAISFPTL